MNLLIDEKKTQTQKQTDTYRYTVDQGGELNIQASYGSDRRVTIVFVNRKLYSVSHNLNDFNLRSNWHIFGSIAEQINTLEKSYTS